VVTGKTLKLPSLAIRSAAWSLNSLASFSLLNLRVPVLLSASVTLPLMPPPSIPGPLTVPPAPTELVSPMTKRTSQTPGDTSSGSSAVTV
jgi:hypothetical protein